MVKVIKDCGVYFNGLSQRLIKGTKFPKDSEIVLKNPSLFEEIVQETKKATVKPSKPAKKEPVEELLVEEPVAPAEVIVEEKEEIEKPVKRTRRKKTSDK